MGNVVQIPYNFNPRPYQLRVFQALDGVLGKPETKKNRAFLLWHRRAGKDKTCFAYMAKEAARVPGIYYYCFPLYGQARKALWESLDRDGFRTLDHLPSVSGVSGVVKRVNNQEMFIELHNGSIIRMIGTDNIDTIRGSNPRGIVFSEWADQDHGVWAALSPILAENGGWAIFNGTPKGRNHMYKMYLALQSRDNWYVSKMDVIDSGMEDLLWDAIQEDRAINGDDYVDQEYYVKFSSGAAGAIFMKHIEKAREAGHIGAFPFDDHRSVTTYWDIGNEGTAIWFAQHNGTQITFIDFWRGANKDLKDFVDILGNKGYTYSEHWLPHDGSHKGSGVLKSTADQYADVFREFRISGDVRTALKFAKKLEAIQATKSRMSRMYWNEGTCFEGLELLSSYHMRFDSKRATFLEEPVHDCSSHTADAFMTEAAAAETSGSEVSQYRNKRPTAITEFNVFGD